MKRDLSPKRNVTPNPATTPAAGPVRRPQAETTSQDGDLPPPQRVLTMPLTMQAPLPLPPLPFANPAAFNWNDASEVVQATGRLIAQDRSLSGLGAALVENGFNSQILQEAPNLATKNPSHMLVGDLFVERKAEPLLASFGYRRLNNLCVLPTSNYRLSSQLVTPTAHKPTSVYHFTRVVPQVNNQNNEDVKVAKILLPDHTQQSFEELQRLPPKVHGGYKKDETVFLCRDGLALWTSRGTYERPSFDETELPIRMAAGVAFALTNRLASARECFHFVADKTPHPLAVVAQQLLVGPPPEMMPPLAVVDQLVSEIPALVAAAARDYLERLLV